MFIVMIEALHILYNLFGVIVHNSEWLGSDQALAGFLTSPASNSLYK